MQNTKPIVGVHIPVSFAKRYWKSFLRRTENMSYSEAERELPYPVFEVYKKHYPERCPKEIEKLSSFQPKLKAEKSEKKKANENQPSLF